MSAPVEKKFVRLFLPKLGSWITSFDVSAGSFGLAIVSDRANASVFPDPSPVHIAEISTRFSLVHVIPATFADWIEQHSGGDSAGKIKLMNG